MKVLFFDITMNMTTKEKVLKILAEAKGQSVSGETLAAECGVSRAAVWKAVTALREAGNSIEGTTNGGYVLADDDIFSQEIFSETFSARWPDFSDCHIECFKEIDSTNTHAKRLLAETGNPRQYHKAILIAEKQTAGRGRIGRTFVSPEKSGIYFSIIYAPEGGITDPARLTASSAVAVCRALKKVFADADIEPQIKWINDIFLGGKKSCGIGSEGITNFESGIIEAAIIGIGVNIKRNPQIEGTELEKIAGSIEEALSSDNSTPLPDFNRCQIAAEIIGQVLKILEEDSKSPSAHAKIIDEYKASSFLLGKKVTVFPLIGDEKSSYKATATDIDENAGLVVTLKDGSTKTLHSGEVSLKSGEFVT